MFEVSLHQHAAVSRINQLRESFSNTHFSLSPFRIRLIGFQTLSQFQTGMYHHGITSVEIPEFGSHFRPSTTTGNYNVSKRSSIYSSRNALLQVTPFSSTIYPVLIDQPPISARRRNRFHGQPRGLSKAARMHWQDHLTHLRTSTISTSTLF